MGTQVLPPRGGTDILLHVLGQFDAILHVVILNKLEHDVTLWHAGIVAMIGLLVVGLHQNHGVLTLCHLQVLNESRASMPSASQRVGLEATGRLPFGQCIDVYGDKQVGLVLVGYFSTLPQLYEAVGLAGIDDLHVGTVALDHCTESQCIAQRQVLLLGLGSRGSPIIAAMSRIDDERELLPCLKADCRGNAEDHQEEKKQHILLQTEKSYRLMMVIHILLKMNIKSIINMKIMIQIFIK